MPRVFTIIIESVGYLDSRGALILSGMPCIPAHAWIEKAMREKYEYVNRQELSWNLLVREIRAINHRQNQILRRLYAYGDRLHNVEHEIGITANAANNSVIDVETAKTACKILEHKVSNLLIKKLKLNNQ